MGWFNDQVKLRKQYDAKSVEDAFKSIAGSIIGSRHFDSDKSKEIAKSAIDEILKYYGYKSKFETLPDSVDTVDKQIDYELRPFGIMKREVELDGQWYKDAVGPMLTTFVEDDVVVALIPGVINGYRYFDYKTNNYVHINKENAKLFDSRALCFYYPLPQRKLSVVDLAKYMISLLSTSDIIIYLSMMFVCTLVGMISPQITKWLLSDVVESKNVQMLTSLSVFIVCYTLASLLIESFKSLINSRINIKQNIYLQAAIMARIISLPVSFFKDYSSGELNRRASYVQSLCSTIMSVIGVTGLTSVFSLAYISQVFVYAKELVIPSLLITLSTVVFSIITTFMQISITQKRMLVSTKESGLSYSMITGIQKIKLSGSEKRMFSRWAKLYAESAMLQYNPPTILKLRGVISAAISLLGNVVLYYLAIKSKVSVADYYAFTSAFGYISSSFMSLASITNIIADIKPTLQMAKPILDAEVEVAEGKEIITSIEGNIELNNVSFRYNENMPMVIDDLSLKIKAGDYLAIVGTTGCGKSTLLRLMLGFEKPLRGAIYYDKKDISRVDMQSLRKQIGVVMQNGKLFTGDIYSNIVISAPQLGMDEAWEAAEIASIADDIREMPMGMHTLISEGQGGISGGQKQRLVIARAIAPKPKVLMFDEATSALDNLTQKKVSEAIDGLKCTRIVIAHRLSTIRQCNRIVVLDKGKIVEDGTYEELLKNNGLFAQLVERQRLDIEEE